MRMWVGVDEAAADEAEDKDDIVVYYRGCEGIVEYVGGCDEGCRDGDEAEVVLVRSRGKQCKRIT